MTEKELLYYEDAVNNEKNTIDICKFIIDAITDDELADFMGKQMKKHEEIKEELICRMEELLDE